MCVDGSVQSRTFEHTGLLYGSEQEYIETVVPFVLDGVNLGQPVRVAAPNQNLALLDQALGDAADRVTTVDAESALANPGRHLPVMASFVAASAGQPVRVVGEGLWPGRTSAEYAAWMECEALFNTPFTNGATAVMGLCPYDTRRLDAHAGDVLTDVFMTHPIVWQNGTPVASDRYAPDEVRARYSHPLDRPAEAAGFVVTTATELAGLRAFVAEHAGRLGLTADRVADLQIVATELATNSLQHAGDACDLAVWHHNGYLVCDARDHGRLDDPLAGRRLPAPDSIGGRGLWAVNALSDVFRVHTRPAGTAIQTYTRLGEPR